MLWEIQGLRNSKDIKGCIRDQGRSGNKGERTRIKNEED